MDHIMGHKTNFNILKELNQIIYPAIMELKLIAEIILKILKYLELNCTILSNLCFKGGNYKYSAMNKNKNITLNFRDVPKAAHGEIITNDYTRNVSD